MQQHVIKFHFICPQQLTVSKELEINMYRIVQEFVNNSIKYSKTNHLYIKISETHFHCILELRDDGCGFDMDASRYKGNGLSNMATRIKAFNGQCQYTSKPGNGTRFWIKFPITEKKLVK